MAELHFIRPYMLYAFIPLAVALAILCSKSRENHEWSKVCDPHLLKHLLVNISAKIRYLSLFFIAIVGALMVLALAGPSWQRLPQLSYSKSEATVIALDVSSHMLARDVTPNRLMRAKFKIHDILDKIKEGQVGLIVFTSEPFLVSPLTKDNETLKLFLPELSPNIMPVDGSNIKAALKMANTIIHQAGYSKGRIILVTANNANENDIQYARKLNKEGIHLSVLAMSTPLGAPVYDATGRDVLSKLDKKSLSDLATSGGGVMSVFSGSNADLKHLLSYNRYGKSKYKKEDTIITKYKDEGRLLILFILPLILIAFRKGWLESMR